MSSTVVRQYATKVVNYSTEYGRSGSSSYTACNLAGGPQLTGRYGDFTEAFVLRAYGPWWNICPSAARPLKNRPTHFISQDFVELEYGLEVIPSGINILENYHPGAVVRILACNSHSKNANRPGEVRWETLWSGLPQQKEAEKRYRTFSPPLKNIDYPTKLIRLEFNSEGCGYYTELDAVELVGKSPSGHQKNKNREEGFLTSLTTRLLKRMTLVERQVSVEEDTEEFDKWGFFSWLPDEVMQSIFQYLDIVSLSRAAQVCSLFLKHSYDPLRYTELDLQPFWKSVDDVALKGLHSRCKNLQHLSLSWTGGGGLITDLELCNFLRQCGKRLITLRLGCCQYISRATLETVVKECPVLEELDLQSCCQLTSEDLLLLNKLTKLKRLNLYRMKLGKNMLENLGNGCTQLEHLNIGSCQIQADSDALHELLSKLQNLVSLDLWRYRDISTVTMEILALSCPNLQELDIGWCQPIIKSGVENPDQVFSCWPKLKKIFFTCGRAISDREVEAIARHCPQLEQFDILGSGSVTKYSIENMLKRCAKLQLLDVSFASKIDDQTVAEWVKEYPQVCIKKSFQ